ncbi:MAG: NUDIX hydrolase [Pirellulales bacterium]
MPLSIDDLLDPQELRQLERAYGEYDRLHFTIECSKSTRKFRGKRVETRRGESLFVLQRSDGRILLHTKGSYPDQTFRLPTGGIGWDEPVVESMRREVFEETGFKVHSERLLAVLTYSFQEGKRSAPYATYVFHVTDVPDEASPLDESEGITGFQWLLPSELQPVIDKLGNLAEGGSGRDDWGRFRAVAHQYVMACDWAEVARSA